MEIFTSITFWVIVVAIIVILGIIGYLAEGTIFANKNKKEVKAEKKQEKENLDAWTKGSSTEAELRQEKVYQTADKSWNEIPDAPATITPVAEDNTGNETIDFAMPEFAKANEPVTDSIFSVPGPESQIEPTVTEPSPLPEASAPSVSEVSTPVIEENTVVGETLEQTPSVFNQPSAEVEPIPEATPVPEPSAPSVSEGPTLAIEEKPVVGETLEQAPPVFNQPSAEVEPIPEETLVPAQTNQSKEANQAESLDIWKS